MCFRKTPEPKIPGFDICLCRKSIRKRFAFSRFAPDYRFDNSERLFFGFFDAFVSYAAVTATFFPVSLMLHHAHTIKQLIPAAFNFFSVFSAFLRSV